MSFSKPQRNIEVNATLSKARGFNLFAEKPEGATNGEANDEYLLKLDAKIALEDLDWIKEVKDEMVEFLVILDKSGSMGGKPWEQVQSAMTKMLNMTSENNKISTDIMVYNTSAEIIGNSHLEIKRIRAGGSTNFVAVFNKIQEMLQERMKSKEKRKLFVFFMTDGCDTCNTEDYILQAKEKLQDDITNYGQEIIFHVLGFSAYHDEKFLESLTLLGTADGSYSYISPKDGDVALETRLTNLLEATTGLVGKSVFMELKMTGQGCQFLGEFFGSGPDDIALQAFMKPQGNEVIIETQKFVKVPDIANFGMTIKLLRNLKDESFETTCKLSSVEVVDRIQTVGTHYNVMTMKKLRASLNMLTSRIENAFDDERGETNFANQLKTLEEWFKVINQASKDAKVNEESGQDEDVQKLAKAIQDGLNICERAFSEEKNETMAEKSKRIRAIHTNWNIASNQMHNVMQSRKKGGTSGKEYGARDQQRSTMQMKQTHSDQF